MYEETMFWDLDSMLYNLVIGVIMEQHLMHVKGESMERLPGIVRILLMLGALVLFAVCNGG